jgi:hypothetical protein
MIARYKLPVADILHSESLHCYPAESEAAKIFVKWLKEHPDVSPDDVDMYIDSYEREEDHYGNGGGYDRYIKIVKRREETQQEYDDRIKREEGACFEKFGGQVYGNVVELIKDLSIYPNMESDEISDKRGEIVNGIMDVVHKCLPQSI